MVRRQKVYVFDPAARVIQRWDLQQLKKEPDAPFPFPGKIKALAHGLGSDGPALVVTDEPADAWPVHFLNLDTLAPADVAWGVKPPGNFPRDLTVRASVDGSAWVAVPKGESPVKAVGIKLEGKWLRFSLPFKDAPGYAFPTADGDAIFSKFGRTPWAAFPTDPPAADPDTTRTNIGTSPLELVVRRAGDRARLSVFALGAVPVFGDLDIPAARGWRRTSALYLAADGRGGARGRARPGRVL